MQIRKSIFLYTALFYTLYIIFPLFGDLVNLPVWLPSLLSVVVMIILYPKAFRNKLMGWFIVYSAVLAFYVIIGKPLTIGIGTVEDNKKIFIEFAYILPTISIFSIFYYLNDNDLISKYAKWSTIILFASFIVAVPLMIKYSSLREALDNQSETLIIPGLPNYSLMHAYTLFLPALCYATRVFKGYQKVLGIFSVLVLLFVIYSTFVTTSLLISLAILLLVFTYRSTNTTIYLVLLLFLFFTLWALNQTGIFVKLIDAIYPYFEGTAVDSKLDDFRASLVGGELQGSNIVGREGLHNISWSSFFNSPIWGNPIVGGHSAIIDRLGGLGLLGGLPFIMMFVSFYRMIHPRLLNPQIRFFFIIGFGAGMIYLYEKGLWGCESWLMLMVMMPSALLAVNSVKKRT